MSRVGGLDGVFGKLKAFEAVVVDVDPQNGTISIATDIDGTGATIVEPIYAAFGGTSDCGIFSFPDIGSRVLCTSVHPARSSPVQIIKVLSGENRISTAINSSPGDDVPAGWAPYPIRTMNIGDIRILNKGGAELFLKNSAVNSQIMLKNVTGAGLYMSSRGYSTKATMVSDSYQGVSDGLRLRHGPVLRTRVEQTVSGGTASNPINIEPGQVGHRLSAPWQMGVGIERGLFPGARASDVSFMRQPRNAPLSEYRMVINEFCETSGFLGFDTESEVSMETSYAALRDDDRVRALDPKNILHLEPHQLVEIVGGNLINFRGEALDINYNVVQVGEADGTPYASNLGKNYEAARRSTRRGIGYHFQLATRASSFANESKPGSKDNFVFSVDKEGVLKVNVPKSTLSGNIPYITDSNFYNIDGGTSTTPDAGVDGGLEGREEVIPVTLRSKKNNILYPTEDARSALTSEGDPRRRTGIRFSNEDGYFSGFEAVASGAGTSVRVNTTKWHNMYAAAEQLIANYVTRLHIAPTSVRCSNTVHGTPIMEPFEKQNPELLGDGTNPALLTYMSTVEVMPQKPAIDPGGGVIVAGQNLTPEADNQQNVINYPYSNSFEISESPEGDLSATNIGTADAPRKNPGGKSANINLEGSIEMSVGADSHDGKSMVLDTAGSLVAWFGKDSNGRSMIVQTDGGVMVNIGGHNGNDFNKGRFDLRVNVTNKGIVGDTEFKPDGGHNASDYLISISENGLVIAGMKPGANMIIRNDGNLMLESTNKLILAGTNIECREGNRPPRPTYKAPVSQDTPTSDGESITPEEIIDMVACLAEVATKLTED